MELLKFFPDIRIGDVFVKKDGEIELNHNSMKSLGWKPGGKEQNKNVYYRRSKI